MTHLVNTLKLDITCGTEDDAFGLQHNLVPVLQRQVAQAIEKAAKHTDPAGLVIIERIEIDLGEISFHSNEYTLAAAIEYEVARQLQPYLQLKPVAEKNNDQQQNATELFRHFMLTGNLPWWAQAMQPDISSVFIKLMETRQDWVINFLYENRASQVFWQRLVFQLNAGAKKLVAGSVKEIKQATEISRVTWQGRDGGSKTCRRNRKKKYRLCGMAGHRDSFGRKFARYTVDECPRDI
jgi:hypothetical protein